MRTWRNCSDERDLQRTEPPVEVLEAIVALPSPWSQRFQLSYAV
jgi:hypothetical protein